jgi:hypothetical protein
MRTDLRGFEVFMHSHKARLAPERRQRGNALVGKALRRRAVTMIADAHVFQWRDTGRFAVGWPKFVQ